MKKVRMKATFVGEMTVTDNFTYKPNEEYILLVWQQQSNTINIAVMDGMSTASNCIYSNLFSFLQNWNNITHYEK